jgi:hypothetical protein
MKTVIVVLFFGMSFIAFLCEPAKQDPVVGSNKDVEISGLAFIIDRSYVSGTTMYVNGTVRNNASGTITPPWYVEGQFYSDSTHSLKLGGANVQINVPLSQGQSTLWNLAYTPALSAQYYPNFKVGDLRAVYKR